MRPYRWGDVGCLNAPHERWQSAVDGRCAGGRGAVGEASMGTKYKGTFSVKNSTGGEISGVYVKHHAETIFQQNTKEDTSVMVDVLANGASSEPAELYSETGVNDLWDVRFYVYRPAPGGVRGTVPVHYVRLNKVCNYEQEDAPQNCVIEIKVGTFSVIMPVSSSCMDNYIHSEIGA
jgi:hypothetical protein